MMLQTCRPICDRKPDKLAQIHSVYQTGPAAQKSNNQLQAQSDQKYSDDERNIRSFHQCWGTVPHSGARAPVSFLPRSFLCGWKLMRNCRHSLSFQLALGYQIMSTHQNAASLRGVRGKVGKEINTRAGVQSVQRLVAPSGSVSSILRSTRQRGRLHANRISQLG